MTLNVALPYSDVWQVRAMRRPQLMAGIAMQNNGVELLANMRIAVLDGDPVQAELVHKLLSAGGHICRTYARGQAFLRHLRSETYDLLVLERNVPDVSGEEVLRRVRESLSKRLPVLFLTSRSDDDEIASILNKGADDCVVKPVAAGVLLARVGSLLRRAYQGNTEALKEVFDEYEFDLNARQVLVRGKPITVTAKEFDLGLLLFQHLSRPLSRTHILDLVWKQNSAISSRTVDTHISTLRSKLGLRPEYGYRLAPVYCYGYRLDRLKRAVLSSSIA